MSMPFCREMSFSFCSQYGAPSYYSPPVSGPPAPGPASGTHYGDWDGDYEEEEYDDDDDNTNNNSNNANSKKNNNIKSNAITNSQKPEDPQTYGTHSWWETPYTNYQAPPASNTW
jgi:hypothetical protein